MRYSNPRERYICGLSPNGMYLAGSKKSVSFEESARKLQFCSAGKGFSGGHNGSGGGPGGCGSGVCAPADNAKSAISRASKTKYQRRPLVLFIPDRLSAKCGERVSVAMASLR